MDEDEQAEVPRQMADAARYAAHYGLPPLQTNDGVITLLVAAEVIHEIPGRDGVLRLHPAHPLPAPADVFPLAEDEAAIQRRMRFEAAHEDDSSVPAPRAHGAGMRGWVQLSHQPVADLIRASMDPASVDSEAMGRR
ncbi:DUF6042 family protein [Streptomyces sp. NBC_00057]|uniref:DUF6042 family protein n=1 Tax=Streptomyces sp. NBC_00057 TaxID=2975634 RepID=UPI00325379C7